jgi:hypothetical protein
MRVRVAEDSLIFEVYNTRRGKTQAKNRGNVLLFSRIRKFPRVLPPSVALYDREQVCRGYWESLRWFKVDDRPGHVAAPSFFLRYRQPTRLEKYGRHVGFVALLENRLDADLCLGKPVF